MLAKPTTSANYQSLIASADHTKQFESNTMGNSKLFASQLQYKIDKSILLTNLVPAAKFLTMERVEPNKNLTSISSLLLKKVIDSVCGGEIEECIKMHDGTILMKTKTILQASKLIQLTAIDSGIHVHVHEHKTLNHSKGVVHSPDLRQLSEKAIVDTLEQQNVISCRKITQRQLDNTRTETELVQLTFSTPLPPNEIKVGYQIVKVRPYIPPLPWCFNCGRLSHLARACKGEAHCLDCGKLVHGDTQSCSGPKCCINCKESGMEDYWHSVLDNDCPTFNKHKAIQIIRITEKTDLRQAIKIYSERYGGFNKARPTNNYRWQDISRFQQQCNY